MSLVNKAFLEYDSLYSFVHCVVHLSGLLSLSLIHTYSCKHTHWDAARLHNEYSRNRIGRH